MPRLSTAFIRAALIHLIVGVLLGGLILSAKGMPSSLGWSWLLLPAHIQLMLGGWMIQLALGVACWILPRRDGTGDRGRPGAAWLCFALLNTGIVGAALLLTLRSWFDGAWLDGLLVLAVLAQLLALAAFAWHAWPRVAPTFAPARTATR
ncbi:MAG TPA: hypothetical protein VGD58_25590 [Herpetosiphonaceae bacterium]